jgi:hypothetical protein
VCANVFWDKTVKRHCTAERNAFGIWSCGNFKTHP